MEFFLDIDSLPALIIFVPVFFALTIYLLPGRLSFILALACQTILSALCAYYFTSIFDMPSHTVSVGSWPENIAITLRNDHLSISFALVSLLLWWCVILFSFYEKADRDYLFFIVFLEGAFTGLLMSNDLFNLFVFIEIVTILSTMLITFKRDKASLRAGFYYLLFNNAGMLFYLVAFIILYLKCGALNLQTMKASVSGMSGDFEVKAAFVMISAAFGVKSAFFPVYNWLPKAHSAAPSSVSALLSGLLVKSGLYEFIRLSEVVHIASMDSFFIALGGITAVAGALFALCQKDIKLILAFHTVSQAGIMLMGIGPFNGFLYSGGLVHLVNHSIFKSLLFLCAGVIISSYKNRSVTQIRGVFKRLPAVSVFMVTGMLSITGMPCLSGCAGKSILSYSLSGSPLQLWTLRIASVGTAASFIKLSQIFFSQGTGLSFERQRTGVGVNASLFLLSLGCVLSGLMYNVIGEVLLEVPVPPIHAFSAGKFTEYALTMSAGYAVYLLIKREPAFVRSVREFDLSFRDSCLMLTGFVCVMAGALFALS